MNLKTIVFENNTLKIIDQTRLPQVFEYIQLNTLDDVLDAIKKLKVRGAPAIGIVAAYGLYIHALNLKDRGELTKSAFLHAGLSLKSARPTAVNLSWAVERMIECFLKVKTNDNKLLLKNLQDEAEQIHLSDRKTCDLIGKYGAELLGTDANILTHCNAGILATGGKGTALSVVYTASQTSDIHVYVDETRPVGQGARLTYWELQKNNIPATLIADNMAAMLMQQKKIDAVIVGADRITKIGDVANKIGTYALAVLADFHKIPFYVAAPLSTFDISLEYGNEIPIEYRDKNEILSYWNLDSMENIQVYNPAFDVTPAHLVSAIITEKGVVSKPDSQKVLNLFTNLS